MYVCMYVSMFCLVVIVLTVFKHFVTDDDVGNIETFYKLKNVTTFLKIMSYCET